MEGTLKNNQPFFLSEDERKNPHLVFDNISSVLEIQECYRMLNNMVHSFWQGERSDALTREERGNYSLFIEIVYTLLEMAYLPDAYKKNIFQD